MSVRDVIEAAREWEGRLARLKTRSGKPRKAKSRELAEAIRVSGSYISNLRRGKRDLTLDLIQKIMKRYHKSWNSIGKIYEK